MHSSESNQNSAADANAVGQGRRAILNDGYRFKNPTIIALCKLVDGLLGLLPLERRALPDRVAKILVIKPDHLGDMLTLTAVLPLLHGRYPGASIHVLCHELSMGLLANNPHVSRCIPFVHFLYDRRKISLARKVCQSLRRAFPLLMGLRREQYELCLNFRDSGGDMILLARLARCGYLVGHGTGGFAPLLDQVVPWQEGRHEVEHYLEVLRPLGIEAALDQLNYELYPTQEDEARVAMVMGSRGLDRFIVIHPGSGDVRKTVNADIWAGIIGGADTDCRIAFTGTAVESHLYEAVAGPASRETVNLMGLLTVPQLYLLYGKAQRVYTVDSLSAHLAAMSGTRTTVFWSPWVDETQWRPLGTQVEIVPRDTIQGWLAKQVHGCGICV